MSLRPALDGPSRELIRHLTPFTPSDPDTSENFSLCHAYVASNLLYHTYLEPIQKNVLGDYSGLEQKLRAHVQRDKADALKEIVDRLKQQEVFNNPGPQEQHDMLPRMMTILWNLAESPLNADWNRERDLKSARLEEEDDDGEPEVDWRAVLAEGEEVWSPGGSEQDDLSDWTESEEEEEPKKEKAPEGDWLAGSAGKKSPELVPSLMSAEAAEEWIRARVQPQYWKENVGGPSVDGNPKHARLVQRVDAALVKAGMPVHQKTVLSEYQLLRECLWMLRNPVASTVFKRDSATGRFSFVDNICIPSVTPEALFSSFGAFCILLQQLRVLKDFCEDVFAEQNNLDSCLPYTYEAYVSALSEILTIMSADVLKIESVVTAQEKTYPLLDMFRDLESWMGKIGNLHEAHVGAVETLDSTLPNWHKAVKVISALFRRLQCSYDEAEYNMALNIFLKTVAPYFRIIGLWLFEGRLEDFRQEFIIHKVQKEEESETYWKQGFVVQPFMEALEEDDLILPPLLAKNLSKILVCGKSNEILTLLKKHSDIVVKCGEDGSALWHEASLFERFLSTVRNDLVVAGANVDVPDFHATNSRIPKLSHMPVSFTDHEQLDMDPYLQLAFKEVYDSINCDETDDAGDRDSLSSIFILGSSKIDPILPINSVFERALHPIVEQRYMSSCSALVTLIRDKICLEDHLGCVRRVYLMEAGDLMQEFYTDIFRRLETDLESLDSTSVTLFLQDCIGRRYPGESERFSVTVPDLLPGEDVDPNDYLQEITLSYRMDWPLNIVLNTANITKYNKVFLFLLRVKQALWTLLQINAKDLADSLSPKESSTESSSEEELEEELPEDKELALAADGVKMHRLLLLRSWLFHFIGNVHSYFMTRVLHSTEFELRSRLAECKDLDEILNTHTLYLQRIHDRCFLHKSASILLEAVLKVLGVCQGLKDAVRDGVPAMPLERLLQLEETYVRSHHFLASTLSSMTQKRNVPHLEGLAAALVYSCPARV